MYTGAIPSSTKVFKVSSIANWSIWWYITVVFLPLEIVVSQLLDRHSQLHQLLTLAVVYPVQALQSRWNTVIHQLLLAHEHLVYQFFYVWVFHEIILAGVTKL